MEHRKDTLERYNDRCMKASRILLFSPGSEFAIRRKLSIWDVADVFVDGTIHLSIGFTSEMVRKMIEAGLREEEE